MDLRTVLAQICQYYRNGTIAFYVAAGISRDPPSNLPLGEELADGVAAGLYDVLNRADTALLKQAVRQCSLEEACGLIQREMSDPRRLIDAMADALDNDRLAQNQNHHFLAKALHDGHVVVTTNYDSQIERAYRHLYSKHFPFSRILYDDASFKAFNTATLTPRAGTSDNVGWLLKLHGSFRVGQKITSDSVATTLERVGKGLPPNAEKVLRAVLLYCPIVVMGYGAMDIDIVYPVLVRTESAQPMWWIKHGTQKAVQPYADLRDQTADQERKLSKGDSIDVHLVNELRILQARALSSGGKSWLIRDTSSVVVDGLMVEIGSERATVTRASDLDPEYWRHRLHEFGKALPHGEKLMTLAKLAQVSAIRRFPNTGAIFPSANEMYDLSDRLLNEALSVTERSVKTRIYRELGWNQYRRNPEGNARSAIAFYRQSETLVPMKGPDPFVLGLNSLAHLRAREIPQALSTALEAWNALPAGIRELATTNSESISVDVADRRLGELDYVATGSVLRRVAAAFNGYVSDPGTLSTSIEFGTVWQVHPNERKLLERARQLCEAARILDQKTGERREQIQAENFLGLICSKLADGPSATKAHEASRHIAEQFGWYPELPQAIRNLGLAHETNAMLTDAIATLETAKRLFADAERKEDVITTLWHIGRIRIKARQQQGIDDITAHLEGIEGTRLGMWHWRANDYCLLGIAFWDILGDVPTSMGNFELMLREYQSGNGLVDFRAQSYGVDNALANVISAISRLSREQVIKSSLVADLTSLKDHLEKERLAALSNIPSI